MIDLHKHWKAKKDLAEKLYKAGIKDRHAEMQNDMKNRLTNFKERVKLFSGRTPEQLRQVASNAPPNISGDDYIVQLKENLKQAGTNLTRTIKEEAKFPVDFDLNLGGLLDKFMAYFKKGDESKRDDWDKVTDRALVVISNYRASITDNKKKLDIGDPDIPDMLKKALTEIEDALRNWRNHSAPSIDQNIWHDCEQCLKEWEEAKKKSQKAHKSLPKEAQLYLKSEKYDGYPIKFNRGLTTAVKAFKNFTSAKDSITKMKNEVNLVVIGYRSDLEGVKKKYERLIPKFGGYTREIIEPLEEALDSAESSIVKR